MKIKKWMTVTLASVTAFFIMGVGSVYAWYEATIHIPRKSNWYTVQRDATGATQKTKVKYVGGNNCVMQAIVDHARKRLAPEQGCTIGKEYSHKTDSKKGRKISARFRNTTYVNVQTTVAWEP